MSEYRRGIKVLTEKNFLEPDRTSMRFSPRGLGAPVKATKAEIENRVKSVLEIGLKETTPPQICNLFDVAKGAMVYGIFFYPLYTLGMEQLTRVFEAAVSHKVGEINPRLSNMNLRPKVEWLIKRKLLPGPVPERWIALSELRNAFSHPRDQTLVGPPDARRMLRDLKAVIDHLFSLGYSDSGLGSPHKRDSDSLRRSRSECPK